MSAKDIYHDAVRNALEKDGWVITDDPLKLTWGIRELFVDLGAKQLIAAQKQERKIAVEIKSFLGSSPVSELQKALGQYLLYRDILEETEPERLLYLAIRSDTYEEIFSEPLGTLAIKKHNLYFLIFNPKQEAIDQWIE